MSKTSYRYLKGKVQVLRAGAMLISVALHPLLMPTLLFWIIATYAPVLINPFNQSFLYFIFITTFAFPLLVTAVFLGMKSKTFSLRDFLMYRHEDRVFPFAATSMLYMGVTYIMYDAFRTTPYAIFLMASISLLVLLVSLVTAFWKVSAHAAGISGVIGFLGSISYSLPDTNLFKPIVVLILLAGVLFSARLFLKAHTPAQVYVGSLLGFAVSILTMYFIFFPK